jgi:hypothetical protein
MHTRLGRLLVVSYALSLAAFVALASTSCTSSTPSQPSSNTTSGTTGSTSGTISASSLTASLTSPRPLQPASGAMIKNLSQPVTLVVANAVITQSTTVTYAFEVATDGAFANKVVTNTSVAQGANGQTSLQLGTLAPATDYYWHAKAQGGGTTGVFSVASKFTIGPAIAINAPTPVSPLTGTATAGTPTFTVNNATRTGPAGPITYRFDISSSSAFNPVGVTGTVAEGSGQTSFTPNTSLAANTTFYWRATALDQTNSVSSPPSAAQSIVTSLAIDLNSVIISSAIAGAPQDIASWPQTATINVVEQDGNASTGGLMCISFTISDNWPSIPYFGDPTVPIYANQWYFAHINGQWYGGPGEYLRADRPSFCKTGQGTNSIGPDGGWTQPMASWAPQAGELVGYMISTPARAGMRSINERSNIVVQPWHDSSLQGFGVKTKAKK